MLIVEKFPQSKLQKNLSEFSLQAKNKLNQENACQHLNFLVRFPQRKSKIFFEPSLFRTDFYINISPYGI